MDNLINLDNLIKAASTGDYQKILTLIAKELSINKQDVNGTTYLIWACMFDNMNLYILNYTNIVKYLIEFGANVNTRDNSGKTALMWLCNHGVANDTILDIVNYLMLSGSDIDIQDNEGNTALILAVQALNLSMVNNLLKFSPNINLVNNNHKSALDLAEEQKAEEICTVINNYINKLTLRGCFLYWMGQINQQNYDNNIINKYISFPKEIARNIIKFCP